MDPDELMSRKFKQEFRKQIDLVKNNTDGQLFTYAAALNVFAKRLNSNPSSKPILTTWKELIQSVLQSLLNIKQQPSQNALQKFVKMLRPWIENKSYISDVRDNMNILYNLSLNGAWTQPSFQCLIKEEDVNLSELANCLEYEDPAVVVKRLQGLNLNLLKKSAWNLIRAALLKQKFRSNRTFQNAYQIQVVFNIAEPDIVEECKNFEFSVTLELINKFQNEGDTEKMLLLCNSALLYMWKSDTVILTTEMTAKWCEIKLDEFKDNEKFIDYVQDHILSGDSGPSTVTHCLILMQSIWETVKESSRYVCVDILMRALHLLEKEDDPVHQNKIEILETVANLLSKFNVSRLCLLSVFFLEPCVETYLKVARKFRSNLPAELQQERQELQGKLCKYLKKHFLYGHHTDVVEWSAIRRECLSKLSLEDASLVDKEESLLDDGKVSDDTDSSPQQSPDTETSESRIGPCAICRNGYQCPDCQGKSSQVSKKKKSFKYGWSCPAITCNVCSCRMTYICQHLSTKHGWEEEEIGAFAKSLGVTKNAVWTSTIDDLTPYAEGNKDESGLTEEESSISPSSSASSSPRDTKSELSGGLKPAERKAAVENNDKAENDREKESKSGETPEKDRNTVSVDEESVVREKDDKEELNNDDDVLVENPDPNDSMNHEAPTSQDESFFQDGVETKDEVSENQDAPEMQESQGVDEIQTVTGQIEEAEVNVTRKEVEDDESHNGRETSHEKSPEMEKSDIDELEKVKVEDLEVINSPSQEHDVVSQEPDLAMESDGDNELQEREPEVEVNASTEHDAGDSSPERSIRSDISESDEHLEDLSVTSKAEEGSPILDFLKSPLHTTREKVEDVELYPEVTSRAKTSSEQMPEEFEKAIPNKDMEFASSCDGSDTDDDKQPPRARKDIGLVPYSDQSSESPSEVMSPSTSQDSKSEIVRKPNSVDEDDRVSIPQLPPTSEEPFSTQTIIDSQPVATTPQPVTSETLTKAESCLEFLRKPAQKKSKAGFYCPVSDCARVFMHKHTIVAHIKFRHKLNNEEATEMAERAKAVSSQGCEAAKDEEEQDLNKIICSRGWYLKIDAYIYEDEIDEEVLRSAPVQSVRHGIVECVRQLFERPPPNFNYNLASKYLESYWPSLGPCVTQASPNVDDFSDLSMLEPTYSNLGEDDASLSQSSQEVDTGFLQSSNEAQITEEDEANPFAESTEPVPVKKETKNKTTQTSGAKGQIVSKSDHVIVPSSQGKAKKHHPERTKYNPCPTVMSGLAFGKTTTRTLAVQVSLPGTYKKKTVGNSKVVYDISRTHSKKFKIKPKKAQISTPTPSSKDISTNSKNSNAKSSSEIIKVGKTRDPPSRSPAMASKQHAKQMSFEEALTEPNRLILDGKSRNRLSHKFSGAQDKAYLPVDSSTSHNHSADPESKIKKKRSVSVDSLSVREQPKVRKLSHSTEKQPDKEKRLKKDYGAKKKLMKSLPNKDAVAPSISNPEEVAPPNDVSPQKAGSYYDLLRQAQQMSGNGDAFAHESVSEVKKMVKEHNNAESQSTDRKSNVKKVRYLKKKRSISLRKLSSISANDDEVKTVGKRRKKSREENDVHGMADNDQEQTPKDNSRKCPSCGRVMANDFALACHMRKKHKSKCKMFIPGQTSMSTFIDGDPPDKEKRRKSKVSSTSSDETSAAKRRVSKNRKASNKSKVPKNVEPVHTEDASHDAPCAQANDYAPDGVGEHFQSLLNTLPDTLNEIFYSESYRRNAYEKLKDATCELEPINCALTALFCLGRNLYFCAYPGCGQPFTERSSLKRHLSCVHFLDINELVKKTLTLVEGENISLCYECNKKFRKLKDLESHARRHHFKFVDRAEPLSLSINQKTILINKLGKRKFRCVLCEDFSSVALRSVMAHSEQAHGLTEKDVEKNRLLLRIFDAAALDLLDGCMFYWPSRDDSYSYSSDEEYFSVDTDRNEEEQTIDSLDSTFEDEVMNEKSPEHTVFRQLSENHSVNESDAPEMFSCDQSSHDDEVYSYETSLSEADTPMESCGCLHDDSVVTVENKANRATQLRRLAYTQAARKIAMKTPENLQRKKWDEFQNLAYLYNKRAIKKISHALSPARKTKVTSQQVRCTTSLQSTENDYERRCWLCKDVFRKNSNYTTHILHHLRSIDRYCYRCDFPGCLFGFPSSLELANHIPLHSDGCHVCVFCVDQIQPIKTTQDLVVHEKIHHNFAVKSLARLRNWFCLNGFGGCHEETRCGPLLAADLDGNSVYLSVRDHNDRMKHFLWYHQRSCHRAVVQNVNEVFQAERRPQLFDERQFEAEDKDVKQQAYAIMIDVLDTLEEAEQQASSSHCTDEANAQTSTIDSSENLSGGRGEKLDCGSKDANKDGVIVTATTSLLTKEFDHSSGCDARSVRQDDNENSLSRVPKLLKLNDVVNGNVFGERRNQTSACRKRGNEAVVASCSDSIPKVEMPLEKGKVRSDVTLGYDSEKNSDSQAGECRTIDAEVPLVRWEDCRDPSRSPGVVSRVNSVDCGNKPKEKNLLGVSHESKTTLDPEETDYENLFDRYREEMLRHVENGCASPDVVLLHENPMESLVNRTAGDLSENRNRTAKEEDPCVEDRNAAIVSKAAVIDTLTPHAERTSDAEDSRPTEVRDPSRYVSTLRKDTTKACVESILSKMCVGSFREQDLILLEVSSVMERMLSHVECMVQCDELGGREAKLFLGVLQLDNSSQMSVLSPCDDAVDKVREVVSSAAGQSETVITVVSTQENHREGKNLCICLKEESISKNSCMNTNTMVSLMDEGLPADHTYAVTSKASRAQSARPPGCSLNWETGSLNTQYDSIHGKLSREQLEKHAQIVNIDIDEPSTVMETGNSATVPVRPSSQPQESQMPHVVAKSCEQERQNFDKLLLDDIYRSIRSCSNAIKRGKRKKNKATYYDPFRTTLGRPIKHADATEPVIPEKWPTDEEYFVNMFPSVFGKRKLENVKSKNHFQDKGQNKKQTKQPKKIAADEIFLPNPTDALSASSVTVPNDETDSAPESQLFDMYCIADVAKCRSRGRKSTGTTGQPVKIIGSQKVSKESSKKSSRHNKVLPVGQKKKGDKTMALANGIDQKPKTHHGLSRSMSPPTETVSACQDSSRPCGACLKMIDEADYLDHLMAHILHPKHRFFCSFPYNRCIYSCRTKKALEQHSKRHAGSKPYLCMFCTDTYRSMALLEDHHAMTHREIKSRFLREIADKRKKILSVTAPVSVRARVELPCDDVTLTSSVSETETANGEVVSESSRKEEGPMQEFSVVENSDDGWNITTEKLDISEKLESRNNTVSASTGGSSSSRTAANEKCPGDRSEIAEASRLSTSQEKAPSPGVRCSKLFTSALGEFNTGIVKEKTPRTEEVFSQNKNAPLSMSVTCRSEPSVFANAICEHGTETRVVGSSKELPREEKKESVTSSHSDCKFRTSFTERCSIAQLYLPTTFAYNNVSTVDNKTTDCKEPKVLVEKISVTSRSPTRGLNVFKIPVGRFAHSSRKASSCSTSVIFTSRASGSFPLPGVSPSRSSYQQACQPVPSLGSAFGSLVRMVDCCKQYSTLTASSLPRPVPASLRTHPIYSANPNTMTMMPTTAVSLQHNTAHLPKATSTASRLVLLEPRPSKKVQIVRPVIRSVTSPKPNILIRQAVVKPHVQVQRSEHSTVVHAVQSASSYTFSRNLPSTMVLQSRWRPSFPTAPTRASTSMSSTPSVSSDTQVIPNSKYVVNVTRPVAKANLSSQTFAFSCQPIVKLKMANSCDLFTAPLIRRAVLSSAQLDKNCSHVTTNITNANPSSWTIAITNRPVAKQKTACAPPDRSVISLSTMEEVEESGNADYSNLPSQTMAMMNRPRTEQEAFPEVDLCSVPFNSSVVSISTKQEEKERDDVTRSKLSNQRRATTQPLAEPDSPFSVDSCSAHSRLSMVLSPAKKDEATKTLHNVTVDIKEITAEIEDDLDEENISSVEVLDCNDDDNDEEDASLASEKDRSCHSLCQKMRSPEDQLQRYEDLALKMQNDETPLKNVCFVLECEESFPSSAELDKHLEEEHLLSAEKEVPRQARQSKKGNSVAGTGKIDTNFINCDVQGDIWKTKRTKLYKDFRTSKRSPLYMLDNRVNSLQMAIQIYQDVKSYAKRSRSILLQPKSSGNSGVFRCSVRTCKSVTESREKLYEHFFKDHTISEVISFLRRRHVKNSKDPRRKKVENETSLSAQKRSFQKACRFKGCPVTFTRESKLTDSQQVTEEIKAHMNEHSRDSVQLIRCGKTVVPMFKSYVSLEALTEDMSAKINKHSYTVICCTGNSTPDKTKEKCPVQEKFVNGGKEVARSYCDNSPVTGKPPPSKVPLTRESSNETFSQQIAEDTVTEPCRDSHRVTADSSSVIDVKLPMFKVSLLKKDTDQDQKNVSMKRPATLIESGIASPKVPRIMLKKLGS